MTIKIIHHDDLDGILGAAVIYHEWRSANPDADYEFFEVNYANFDLDAINVQPEDYVFMVDFSAPREAMEKINETAKLFVWLDHHKTAIEACDGMQIFGLRKVGVAGCALAWQYLCRGEMPQIIKNAARYDIWDHDENVLAHHHGLLTYRLHPTDQILSSLFYDKTADEKFFTECVQVGRVALDAIDAENEFAMKMSYERDVEVPGHGKLRALVCNRMKGSRIFNSRMNYHDFDFMIAWQYDGLIYHYSFYTDNTEIDLTGLAKQHGGGGHAGACGCNSPEMLF